MNKSSVPFARQGETLVDERAEYGGGSEITGGLDRFGRTPDQIRRDRKPYLYPNGRVDVEALQELEARVLALENASPVTDNTPKLEYYEQQIEEISGKWAECDKKRLHQVDLVTELREKLEVKTARNADHRALQEKITQLEAIIAQKNRDIQQARQDSRSYQSELEKLKVHYTYMEEGALEVIEDAKLGALVRQMPKLVHLRQANDPEGGHMPGWIVQVGSQKYDGETPEDALSVFFKAKDGD